MWKRAVDAWVFRHLREARVAMAVLGVLLVGGAAVIAFGGRDGTSRLAQLPPTPPSPSASLAARPPAHSAGPSSSGPTTHPAAHCAATQDRGAGGPVPVHICIASIGVNADVMQLGLNADHTVEVPPLSEVATAGWYKYSPAPGAVGPSVILGHIDSAQYGKGVFYDLGRLRSGDTVRVTRADGMRATFRVTKVAEYPKTDFPTRAVYGNTSAAAIRLITCGGRFDPAAKSYVDNIIAFGTLVSLTR